MLTTADIFTASYPAIAHNFLTSQVFKEIHYTANFFTHLLLYFFDCSKISLAYKVRNFIELARSGFYDGLTVHRVVPNGFIQAGDPRGDGNGGPGYVIRSEPNERPIVRGTIAMAHHGKDTAGSQFFITHLPRPDLDGGYTAFGQVSSGMETVDRLEPGDRIEHITIWDGFTSPYSDP